MKLSLPIPKAKVSLVDLFSRPKLKDYLLGLIIFFAPTQLGLHFWPASALVYGVRVDYLSPTIYLFDLLLLSYLVVSRSDLLSNPEGSRRMFSRTSKTNSETRSDLASILPILITNLLYSQNPLATLSWSLHFLLYLIFITTLTSRIIHNIKYIILASALFQLFLALAQVTLGHSVGGLMYYFGERTVSVGQPAVALATFMGHVVLRAYGTFSHPNILAGWLVICSLILFKLISQRNTKYIILNTTIPIIGIILTQSRAAALAFFGLVLPLTILTKLRHRLLYFASLFVIASLVTAVFSRPTDLSVSERLSLQESSLQLITTFPIFGTGAQASISTYPAVTPTHRLLQPDHNSFTLLLSWFGIFGVIAFLYTLRPQLENWRIYALRILVLFPLLLFDHYLLTSPQGLFIVLLCFYIYSYPKSRRTDQLTNRLTD